MSGSRSIAQALRVVTSGCAFLAVTWAQPSPALACGGFFCSASNPVNQAAERIVFAKNNDGTVTAVIEIQYQGPSESFSWLLPISSVPVGDQIAVASNIAFQRLQQATNPRYNLTTRVEGTCDSVPSRSSGDSSVSAGMPSGGPNLAPSGGKGGVTVEATGLVGAFEWTVISLDPKLSNPADAAVTWLGSNGYDVPPGAPGLLGPYLEDGLYLLALRLQKGADSGSIRPIVLTYEAEQPMIPIKLTAVAANDDMGVLAWVLGDARAVPQNYYSLELNEARINWFNGGANYVQVVTEAADDAGGQGFVTEMAGPASSLANTVWSVGDEQNWSFLAGQASWSFVSVSQFYAAYDGFWDVVREQMVLPAGVSVDQVRACPSCYEVPVDAGFINALEEQVIEPVRLVQKLIDAHPHVTRLYSTLSAPEMTVDPLFSFNPDLPAVSNVHTATRVIECGPGYYVEDAPWRIELPGGGIVRGGPSTLNGWPDALASQPANQRIVRSGESGPGRVVEDNSASISSALDEYGASLPVPPRHESDGCTASGRRSSGGAWFGVLALLGWLGYRRRQPAQPQRRGR